jgi:vitamin K-dependent gamma-carboxylase
MTEQRVSHALSPGGRQGLVSRAFAPVDAASLAVFRVLFGALMAVGVARFMAEGWIDTLYVQPTFFFKYPGFTWLEVPGPTGLSVHFSLMLVAALLVSVGLWTRRAFAAFGVLFMAAELYDVTNYLNHHMLIAWLAVLGAVLPTANVWSVDAWRARRRHRPLAQQVPAWCVWLVRFQVAVVYVFAALAKVGPDWLLHGQPLGIWLQTRTELPVLGPLFALPAAPLVMSWAGFLYDLTIVVWLSWRRSRPLAYAAVVVFHVVTSMLFDIGLFPPLMIIATTVFFAPDWPRRLVGARPALSPGWGARAWSPARPAVALGAALVVGYAAFHVVVPLRHLATEGDVLWDERGMRYAWKVMVRAKTGSITYRVTHKANGRAWQVSPHDYLTWRQAQEMSGQPDLIAQLARHIRWDFVRQGRGDVEVRVDALVSLNGRPAAPLIDPELDLAAAEERDLPAHWIKPLPAGPPLATRLARSTR